MADTKPHHNSTARLGGWLPQDTEHVERWIRKLKKFASEHPRPLIAPIAEFQQMVYSDPVLYSNFQGMFAEAYWLKKRTPLLWEPEPQTFEDFLVLLNAIMTTAPEAYQTVDKKTSELEPAGMIGFPINALLDWPMGTAFGYEVFANSLVNQQFKKILSHWSNFLVAKPSRYVLVRNNPSSGAIAWLGPHAQAEMVKVAMQALGDGTNPISPTATFADIFNCDSNDTYYGFKSWDDFFTRTFRNNVRPVSGVGDDSVIVNACESTPYRLAHHVKGSDSFWIKGQPYSLQNMLNWDEYALLFEGGTVYQAFLSALSYHRWHSPVSGKIVKAYVVNGSYYLESLSKGFFDKNPKEGPDAAAPNNSQGFLTAVATRALILIQADNPAIGLMCVMPVGMAEVSSCEITVKMGDHVNKGDQLGMFHFGGSTHCLIFHPGVNLKFTLYGEQPSEAATTNIRVKTQIATVNSGG